MRSQLDDEIRGFVQRVEGIPIVLPAGRTGLKRGALRFSFTGAANLREGRSWEVGKETEIPSSKRGRNPGGGGEEAHLFRPPQQEEKE